MASDGSHLICKKHLRETDYCSIDKEWICIDCVLEDK